MNDSSSPALFGDLGLNTELLRAVELAGYASPTPVQTAAIPAVLAGRDVRVRAQTGTGKTAAFGLPLLQRLYEHRMRERGSGHPSNRSTRGNRVFVLVLVPTRELATQIGEVLTVLAQPLATPIKILAVFGGVSPNPQMMALRGGADILVATPGRLLDLQRQNAVVLDSLKTLVLDEADRMLSLGFHDELSEILALLPVRRQNLLFSATFPASLSVLTRTLLHDPLDIDLATEAKAALIEQRAYEVDQERKAALLIHLIEQRDLHQVLVFVSAKKTGDALVSKLRRAGLQVAVFHGDKSQAERRRCLDDFKSGGLRVLIATDLAARGLDIEDLPTVINFELPRSPNDYTHRIGRTGRAGRQGVAISLVCPAEYPHFGVIQKRMKLRLAREQVPGFEVHSADRSRR
jgi:4a-hydroxytetrahydrobiopterin dehydratase